MGEAPERSSLSWPGSIRPTPGGDPLPGEGDFPQRAETINAPFHSNWVEIPFHRPRLRRWAMAPGILHWLWAFLFQATPTRAEFERALAGRRQLYLVDERILVVSVVLAALVIIVLPLLLSALVSP